MILLLDVGNTRVKWAWLEYLEIAPSGAVAHDTTHRRWQGEIEADGHRPSRIVVANVAGPAFAAALTLWSRDHFAVEPEFVMTRERLLGVTNGYRRPLALGVDRWLGLIAAWRSAPRATLIVNSGTALTVDALDAGGHHRGGLILPGVQMLAELRASLTPDEPIKAGHALEGLLADPVPFTLATLADRALEELARLVGVAPRLLVTGGDAALLEPYLSSPAEVVPELVLTGLAIVATGGSADD
ncbi:MAG TPA: type III pantothenate kinase [Steroidobacteraceae bacterium]|nr:type III pantothenate kinase [Steroidobacteraceae bacterium]